MTEFYHHDQQPTKLTEPSSLLTNTQMPSFYPATKHRTLITKHLTDHDDDDHDSIYKEAFIVQIFQHWKVKTLEHQHTNNTTPNNFSQALANTITSVETSTIQPIPLENSTNNVEPEKPIATLQKRVKPIPASYARRKEALKKCDTTPPDFANPNFLSPHNINKCRTLSTTTASPKKCIKPGPIFIAPKKTHPPPIPRTYSVCTLDESTQFKRKPNLEKQNSNNDEPISPTWAPAPPITPTRFFVQSPRNSLDDDETSSDDNSNESLLIRNKKGLKKPTKTKINHSLSVPPTFNIPTAIYVTDPIGQSRSYDFITELVDVEPIIDNNINKELSPPTSPFSLDQYALHSIGEEDEGSAEKNVNNGVILSKELDRIEAFTRSRQTNTNEQENNSNENENENDRKQLGRRWSDGAVSDDDTRSPSSQSALVKMASTTSVMKQSTIAPTKISKTKYLLMKLHLTPAINKDDDSNPPPPPPPRKRTVRRSSDKKRYQTH